MAYQNRVNPKGEIVKSPHFGTIMGNRGVLHDENKNIIRQYKLKAWLICLLKYKNHHRTIMQPNRYTELFFLDEATAFSAGHRPCAFCQKERFNEFKLFWQKANCPIYSIKEVDAVLHKERACKDIKISNYALLPSGSFVSIDAHICLVWDKKLYRWSFSGYERLHVKQTACKLLTPKSTVKVFEAGFKPDVHSSILLIAKVKN